MTIGDILANAKKLADNLASRRDGRRINRRRRSGVLLAQQNNSAAALIAPLAAPRSPGRP